MTDIIAQVGAFFIVMVTPVLGCMYHVSWAKSGCVWRCTNIFPNGTVELTTPRGRKKLTVKVSELYHTKRNQQ